MGDDVEVQVPTIVVSRCTLYCSSDVLFRFRCWQWGRRFVAVVGSTSTNRPAPPNNNHGIAHHVEDPPCKGGPEAHRFAFPCGLPFPFTPPLQRW